MEPARDLLVHTVTTIDGTICDLTLRREEASTIYPDMVRYIVEASVPGRDPARYITNTFEYSPLLPGSAESAARQVFTVWEESLRRDPDEIFRHDAIRGRAPPAESCTDLLILQGSPRPDGNCAILCQWAAEAAAESNKTSRVIYPHYLDIHPCIGCYQCYNTGTCVFDDDMQGIIDLARSATLIIVCSPVYSNTVPAGLKLVIDRMQAYHAGRVLAGCGNTGQKAIIYSVAGRGGKENFSCITKVLIAFFHTLGAIPAGEILIDNTDVVHDIRLLEGKEETVKRQVRDCLFGKE